MKTTIWLVLPLSFAFSGAAFALWGALCRAVARGTSAICCFDPQECAPDTK